MGGRGACYVGRGGGVGVVILIGRGDVCVNHCMREGGWVGMGKEGGGGEGGNEISKFGGSYFLAGLFFCEGV